MARPFDFTSHVKQKAFQRQCNLCAHCGLDLRNAWDNAHHVVPSQTGKVGASVDTFLSSIDNCVVLCDPCHYAVHDSGRFRTGAVPPPSYYPYSHGRHSRDYSMWVIKLERLIKS
jgi:hypothetical protein